MDDGSGGRGRTSRLCTRKEGHRKERETPESQQQSNMPTSETNAAHFVSTTSSRPPRRRCQARAQIQLETLVSRGSCPYARRKQKNDMGAARGVSER